MCATAEAEIRARILSCLPSGGRVSAAEVLQKLADDDTCLLHFCAAVLALLERSRIRTDDSLGTRAPADVLQARFQVVPAEAPPPRTLAPGLIVFPDRLLGRGSASGVYRGEDRKSGRPLAVKILEIQGAPSEELKAWYLERFRQEPCLMARLTHPHVVEVVAWGESEEAPWYAMELLDGGTLARRLKIGTRLPAEDVAACFRAVASALAAGAKLGISHRDVKPGNIFSQGFKLADFGMSKVSLGAEGGSAGPGKSITSHGARVGTPAYMPPERAAYGAGDARSDLYSLGATMYHAATGRLLFPLPPDDAKGWAQRHMVSTPVPILEHAPNLPPALAGAIMRCLAKAPNDRFPSFDALVDALH